MKNKKVKYIIVNKDWNDCKIELKNNSFSNHTPIPKVYAIFYKKEGE